MKRRSLIQRIADKLRGAKPPPAAEAVVNAEPATLGAKRPRPKTESSFEPLEGRIAPAVLINASTVQFTDSDGDLVTVQFSKALFQSGIGDEPRTSLNKVFKFADGQDGFLATPGSAQDEHELAMLDLASLASIGIANPANGTSISITAEPQDGEGDGLVNVGFIKAAHSSLFGISLGKVVVDGDLGRITAGDREKTIGIGSITVNSWGVLGTATQLANGTLESAVTSGIGTLTVVEDFQDAVLRVVNGDSATRHAGKIGTLTIGGDLLAAPGNNLANAGAIAAAGSIGKVQVDNILGGGGQNSGKISASGKLGAVTVNGDVRGGAGKDSGQIIGTGGVGKVTLETLWGGAGENSGRISSDGAITSVTLDEIAGHHSFSGVETGKNAATISAGGNVGSITVAENISGGAGEASGRIGVGGTLAKITVGGHLIGGAGASSGQILTGVSLGSLTISGGPQTYTSTEAIAGTDSVAEKQVLDMGDVLGRPSDFTLSFGVPGSAPQTTTGLSSASTAAEIQAALNALPAIGVDGVTVALVAGRIEITFADPGPQAGTFSANVTQASVVGATGAASGSIISTGSIGKITVKNLSGGDVLKAGNGAGSASISATGNVGTLLLEGDLDASGAASLSGAAGINVGGNLKSLTVTGNLIGGSGSFTGAVTAEGSIKTIKLGGSLMGGTGDSSGSIVAGGKITSAFVFGSLVGGTGENSASLVSGTDITVPGDLGKVTILGQLLGSGTDSASVRSGGKLGTVVVGTLGTIPAPVLSGGIGNGSASLVGRTGISSVTVNGHVVGGGGINSATIQSGVKVASVKIAGNLEGGVGDGSGSIAATDLDLGLSILPGNLGKISIVGDLLGDFGDNSGQIRADGSIQSAKVGGLRGDQGDGSGSIVAGRGLAAFLDEFHTIGGIGSLVVNVGLTGGAGTGSGSIEAGAKIAKLTINASVHDASVKTGRDIGSLTINGSLTNALISAQGSAKATARADMAIAKLTVDGNVTNSLIRAGYDLFDNPTNGNAQIGAVKVTGTWTASSIVAGVEDVEGDGFGDDDDRVIGDGTISKIASIVIGQTVIGTAADNDHFGFVAQTIGSVKIAGVAQEIIPLEGNPVTDDTSIREVP